MKPEVINLHIAKKLKELGVTQASRWYYKTMDNGQWHEGEELTLNPNGKIENQNLPKDKFFFMEANLVTPEDISGNDVFSAFTADELGELIIYVQTKFVEKKKLNNPI